MITTDAFAEGRHYRSAWARIPSIGARLPSIVGARLAAANLSDLAAMGAAPRWAVLSAGVREKRTRWLERAQRALALVLARDGAALVGGNLCRIEGSEWLSLTLLGDVKRGHAMRRDGARAGDWIAITGSPGRAAAFVRLADLGRGDPAMLSRWSRPPSRIEFAGALAARRLAHAAIDVSDGVAGDLAQLCRASGVSAELEVAWWPADAALARVAARLRARPLDLALGPSDDYELLLAIPPASRDRCERLARATRTPLAFVGHFTRGRAGELGLHDRARRAAAPHGAWLRSLRPRERALSDRAS